MSPPILLSCIPRWHLASWDYFSRESPRQRRSYHSRLPGLLCCISWSRPGRNHWSRRNAVHRNIQLDAGTGWRIANTLGAAAVLVVAIAAQAADETTGNAAAKRLTPEQG